MLQEARTTRNVFDLAVAYQCGTGRNVGKLKHLSFRNRPERPQRPCEPIKTEKMAGFHNVLGMYTTFARTLPKVAEL